MSLLGLEISKQTTISNFLNKIFDKELSLNFKKHSQGEIFAKFFIFFFLGISYMLLQQELSLVEVTCKVPFIE